MEFRKGQGSGEGESERQTSQAVAKQRKINWNTKDGRHGGRNLIRDQPDPLQTLQWRRRRPGDF